MTPECMNTISALHAALVAAKEVIIETGLCPARTMEKIEEALVLAHHHEESKCSER